MLGSLKARIFKIHLKELRFLRKAGLRLFRGAEARPKAKHTSCREVKAIHLRDSVQTSHSRNCCFKTELCTNLESTEGVDIM